MKKSRKLLAILMTMVLLFTAVPPVLALAADTDLPENAILEQVDPDRVYGGTVWAYTPSELEAPPPMMTAVIFVYPNKPMADMDAAWQKLNDSGILAIAEAEHAAVMMINPLGDTWSEDDILVLNGLISTVGPGGCDPNYFTFSTYYNLMYAVGEGSGATFINQYVTQNCGKIAAVATFGGEMPEGVANYAPLPAYISGGTQAAVDFYKEINDTDSEKTQDGKTEYYNAAHTTKRVVANPDGSTSFQPDDILDAWHSVLRRTTRNCMHYPIWIDKNSDEIFTLMDRPMPDELELTFSKCSDPENLPAQQRWYEWVPNEALDADSDELFPLVMCYHGSGDHPVFEAECNGWVQTAADNRFILVAPENNNFEGLTSGNIDETPNTVENNMALIQYIIDKYPVDISRVYVTGFSQGGANTYATGRAYLDFFAGMAPMGNPYSALGSGLTYDESIIDDIDMPLYEVYGGADIFGTEGDPRHMTNYDTLNAALKLNNIDFEIDTDILDYDAYPFYGFETPEREIKTTKHGVQFDITSWANNDGVVMVKNLVAGDLDHNHYTEYAPEVWSFLKNFSRDPETKEIIYFNADEFAADLAEDGTADYAGWNVDKLADNLYHLDETFVFGASSIYILVDDNDAIIFDGGNPNIINNISPAKTRALVEYLTEGKPITSILVHGHIDHVGLFTDKVLELDSVKNVYINENDYVDDPVNVITAFTSLKGYEDKLSFMKDGDVITVGNYSFDVHDLRGHTTGSSAVVDKAHKLAFSSDSMGSGFVWMLFDYGVNELGLYEKDLDALYESVKDMGEDQIFYAGHRWQQFLSFFPKAPGELTVGYMKNMIDILAATRNGTVVMDDYNSGRGNEKEYALTLDGVNAQICVTEDILREYVEASGGIMGNKATATCGEGQTASVEFTYKGEEPITSARVQLKDAGLGVPTVSSEYDFEYNPDNGKIVVWTDGQFNDGDVLFTVTYDLDVMPYYDDGTYIVDMGIIEATDIDGEVTEIGRLPARIVIDNAYPAGDVNMDGQVDNRDVIMIARYLIDLVTFTPKQELIADYNEDGKIDNTDLVKIARAIIGE